MLGWPVSGIKDQWGGWPSEAKLTWDQRGRAGDWGMIPNGGSHEVSRWHQTSCQQRRRCPQLKSLRCSSTMFTRIHGLSYRGKNRRAAGIESHKLAFLRQWCTSWDCEPRTEKLQQQEQQWERHYWDSNSRKHRHATDSDASRYKEVGTVQSAF